MSLLIVGSIALDSVESPAGKVVDALGGSASYCSVAAGFLSDDVRTVAVIGDDFAPEHIELFKSMGIDVSGIERTPGKTFRWSGVYGRNPNERTTISTELNVFENFNPKLGDKHKESDFVFLGNIHPSLQMDVLNQIGKPELVALDTMNFWIEGTPEELMEVIRRVDVLLVNDSEAMLLAGTDNLVAAAREIRGMGPSTLIIKKGEHGALMFHESGNFAIPALPLENVVDPTGAGDSFAGGFMGYLASVGSSAFTELKRAMAYGSVMASFCVEDFSLDRFRKLDKTGIDERLEMFRRLTSF